MSDEESPQWLGWLAAARFAFLSRPQPSVELLSAARDSDKKAVSKLIAATMWIVHARVRRALRSGRDDADDLAQVALAGSATEGGVFGGLMRAIQTYDPEAGHAWWTYATMWIDSALKDHRHRARRQRRAASTVSYEDVASARAERPRGAMRIGDPALQSPHNPEREADARSRLRRIVHLPARERLAVVAHVAGASYKEIGRSLGVKRERARVITLDGIDKLKAE